MPVVSLTLEDTNRTVLYEAYYKIVQEIAEFIKIPNGQLVIMQRDLPSQLTDNRHNVTINSQDNLPSTTGTRRIQVNITEDYNEDELSPTRVNQPSAYPIFQDLDLDVSVYPVYVKNDVSIQFTYVTPSKNEATRIRDDIRLRLSQTRNINTHEVDYTVLIPAPIEEFIGDIYDLRSRLIDEPLEYYFGTHSTKRVITITDMANASNTRLAVKERHTRIVGAFDFNSIPDKIEVDNELNNYKVNFTYKLSLEVPTAMTMRYPVMVCNQLMPNKYLEFLQARIDNSKEERYRQINYTSNAMYSMSIFENHRYLENQLDISLPVNVPGFDEFRVRQGHKGYGIVATFLTQVDETNQKSLFNLKEIDPYEIPEELLNYIQTEGRNLITTPYQSFLYLGLHQANTYFDRNVLTIDEDLNVSSTVKLSLLSPVRVTLSMCIEYEMLTPYAIARINASDLLVTTFVSEYLSAIRNFQPERRAVKSEIPFIQYLLSLIRQLLTEGRIDTLRHLFEIVKSHPYHDRLFVNGLLGSPSSLLKELKFENVVDVDTKTKTLRKLYTINSELFNADNGFENTAQTSLPRYVTLSNDTPQPKIPFDQSTYLNNARILQTKSN